MEKQKLTITKMKCSHCEYEWNTRSERNFVTCPNCLKKTEKVKQEEEKTCEEFEPSMCSHCGLDLDLHDGSGFCPPGTEEAGGRR